MIEVAGSIAGAVLVRRFWRVPPLVRAAVFAQVADVVTFAIARRAAEDHNPLVNLIYQTITGLTAGIYPVIGEWLTALAFMGMKTALIAYLVWAAPKLGRYRDPVLLIATVAGVIGAISNSPALAYPSVHRRE